LLAQARYRRGSFEQVERVSRVPIFYRSTGSPEQSPVPLPLTQALHEPGQVRRPAG
jgi:hypothetical protein